MGNTSCKHVMTNEMRKESNLYKSRYIIYIASSFTIWWLYVNEQYEGLERWYIMPCTIYLTCYFILGSFIYLIVESLMDKNKLNQQIYKCMQWQQANQNICENKRMGLCIINPYAVKIWNPSQQYINPYPVSETNKKKYYTYDKYVEPRDYDLPNRVDINMNEIKPNNFYKN